MRRQLSQPSFTNGFARSIGESAAPELWPAHAWIPALGNQGGVLFDVAGGRHGSLISDYSWVPDGVLLGNATTGTYNRCSLGSGWGTVFGSKPFSIFCATTPLVKANQRNVAAVGAWDASARSSNSLIVGLNYKDTGTDYYPYFAVRIETTETVLAHTVQWNVGVEERLTCIRNGSSISLSRNGRFVSHGDVSAEAINEGGLPLVVGGILADPKFNTNARYRIVSVYLKALTEPEIQQLNQNPLLPFRRREIQKYWIAGGASGTEDDLSALGVVAGSPSAGSPAVGQTHELDWASLSSGSPSVGSPAVGQAHVVSTGNIAIGQPIVGSPVIQQVHGLSTFGIITQGPIVGSPVLEEVGTFLSANDIDTGNPVVGVPSISQLHLLLVSGISARAPTAGVPALNYAPQQRSFAQIRCLFSIDTMECMASMDSATVEILLENIT